MTIAFLFFWVVILGGFKGRYQHFGEHTVSIFRAEDGDSMFLHYVGVNEFTQHQNSKRTTIMKNECFTKPSLF
jgi:hypothetical protein